MATIRKRGDKYQVQVRRKGARPFSRTFRTHRDADAWARHMEVQADRQELPPDPNQLRQITVAQLLTRYLSTVTPRKKTADRERIMLQAILRRPIASLRLSDVRTADFAAYRDERLKEIKPASVARELAPLRHMFEIARKEWALPLRDNPLSALTVKGANPSRERRLRPGELARLVKAAKGSRNRYLVPIILLALGTAMRRGEILAMKWRDITVWIREPCVVVPAVTLEWSAGRRTVSTGRHCERNRLERLLFCFFFSPRVFGAVTHWRQ